MPAYSGAMTCVFSTPVHGNLLTSTINMLKLLPNYKSPDCHSRNRQNKCFKATGCISMHSYDRMRTNALPKYLLIQNFKTKLNNTTHTQWQWSNAVGYATHTQLVMQLICSWLCNTYAVCYATHMQLAMQHINSGNVTHT